VSFTAIHYTFTFPLYFLQLKFFIVENRSPIVTSAVATLVGYWLWWWWHYCRHSYGYYTF